VNVIESDIRRGRQGVPVVQSGRRHEQAAPESCPSTATAGARSTLGDAVLDRQIPDRRRAGVSEQAPICAGAVENRALAVDGQRIRAGEVDRGNIRAFRKRRAFRERNRVLRVVAAVGLRGGVVAAMSALRSAAVEMFI
jgi:hypothetical protein